MKVSDETMLFRKVDDEPMTAEEVLTRVYQSIQEKGYNPINQILGYLISGDPAYITSYNNARSDIRRLERDDLIEELLKEYDALLMTAQGIETIRRTSLEKDFNRLQELIAEYEVHELVVGMPKNMNGTKGERAEKTEEFVEKMKEVIDLPVSYWDERLSTVMAERQLIAADVSRKKRKSVIDKMAAVVILQGYLDRLQFNK